MAVKKLKVSGSPFIEELMDFGPDETLAYFFNLATTIYITWFLTTSDGVEFLLWLNSHFPYMDDKWVISVAGAIAEKPAFYIIHLIMAFWAYFSTHISQRKVLSYYLKIALIGGSISLSLDIFTHDPIYCGLMKIGQYAGFSAYSIGFLQAVCFFVAMFAAVQIKVFCIDIYFKAYRHWLIKKGLKEEKYLEARFKYPNLELAKVAFDKVKILVEERASDAHNRSAVTWKHEDLYFGVALPWFNKRKPRFRFRLKVAQGQKFLSAQIIYTRAKRVLIRGNGKAGVVVIQKIKLFQDLPFNKLPKRIDTWTTEAVIDYLSKHKKDIEPKQVNFTRSLLFDSQTMFLSLDETNEGVFVEAKVYNNHKRLLIQAIRMLLKTEGAEQLTIGKEDVHTII